MATDGLREIAEKLAEQWGGANTALLERAIRLRDQAWRQGRITSAYGDHSVIQDATDDALNASMAELLKAEAAR